MRLPVYVLVTKCDEVTATAASSAPEIVARERKPVFLFDLFKEKIFREAALAQPIQRIAFSRNRLALAAQILTLVIVVVGGVGLAVGYRRLSPQKKDLYEFLSNEKVDLDKIASPSGENRVGSNLPNNDVVYRPTAYLAQTDPSQADAQDQILHNTETRLLSGMAKAVFHSQFLVQRPQ